MEDVNENIEKYNRTTERKILIAIGDMIADMLNNKNLQ